jgi:hypothetical protein
MPIIADSNARTSPKSFLTNAWEWLQTKLRFTEKPENSPTPTSSAASIQMKLESSLDEDDEMPTLLMAETPLGIPSDDENQLLEEGDQGLQWSPWNQTATVLDGNAEVMGIRCFTSKAANDNVPYMTKALPSFFKSETVLNSGGVNLINCSEVPSNSSRLLASVKFNEQTSCYSTSIYGPVFTPFIQSLKDNEPWQCQENIGFYVTIGMFAIAGCAVLRTGRNILCNKPKTSHLELAGLLDDRTEVVTTSFLDVRLR